MVKYLSTVGFFAYLLNSFFNFSYHRVVRHFEMDSFWLYAALLCCAAALSLVASHYLITLIDLMFHEPIGQGTSARLLDVGNQESSTVLDIPTLVRDSLADSCFNNVLRLAVLYCSLLAIIYWGLLSAESLNLLEFDPSDKALITAAIAVAVAVLNQFDFEQLETLHIAIAACRLIHCALWLASFMPAIRPPSHDFMFVPTFLAAFMYQIPLPGFLAVYRAPSKKQFEMQGVVISFSLLLYFLLLGAKYYSSEVPRDSFVSYATKVLSIISNIGTSQIYWKSFGRILAAWRYGGNIEVVREVHPTSVRVLETCMHLPIFAAYIAFEVFSVASLNSRFPYMNRFLLFVPIFTLGLYWSIVRSCERKAQKLESSEVSRVWMWVWQCVLAGAFLACIWVVAVLLQARGEFSVSFLFPHVIGATTVLALVLWNVYVD